MYNTGTVCCVCRGGANIFKEDNWYCYACWFSSEKESPSQEHNCKYKELASSAYNLLIKLYDNKFEEDKLYIFLNKPEFREYLNRIKQELDL